MIRCTRNAARINCAVDDSQLTTTVDIDQAEGLRLVGANGCVWGDLQCLRLQRGTAQYRENDIEHAIVARRRLFISSHLYD